MAMLAQEISTNEIGKCLSLETTIQRNNCYDSLCEFSMACSRSLVSAATEIGGPEAGFRVLDDLMARNIRDVTKDGHDLAHQVGRSAAIASDGSPEVFLSCPDDYFLGCKHGFFEAMLAELGSPVEAAAAVCGKAPRSERTFCYHGMGHGIMMSAGNDVFRSVLLCDRLSGSVAQRGCYQGVFMENVNAASRGETKADVLDPKDILAPCTRVDPKYRTECFAQHADYVLRSLSGSLLSVVEACERAGESKWVNACIRHVGQNMTTFDYQTHLLGSFDPLAAPEGAAELCNRFPEEHRITCQEGAAHNFMLYDHPESALRFCTLLSADWCHRIILQYLYRPLYTDGDRDRICTLFPDDIERECRYPVAAPLLLKLLHILAAAIVISAVIVLVGWKKIRTPSKV